VRVFRGIHDNERTISPVFTVISEGENSKSRISTTMFLAP